jgi:hypothetical protein
MLYREIIAVCSEFHAKHINALWAEHGFFLMLKLVVHNVLGFKRLIALHVIELSR